MKKFFIFYMALIIVLFCYMNTNFDKVESGVIDTSDNMIIVITKGAVANRKSYSVPNDWNIGRVLKLAVVLPEADIDSIDLSGSIKNNLVINVPYKIININTADVELLKLLDGVGEKTALNIIEYRDKNAFLTIEDFRKYNESLYEKNKDRITV